MTAQANFLAVQHFRSPAPKHAPVLFLHGFMSNGAADWPAAAWVEPLLAAGRDVIVVDLPGHGASAQVENAEAARPSRIVAALADILEEAGGPVDVIGYSLGARLAWSLAAQRENLVRKLVLGGLAPNEPFAALDFPAARRLVDEGIAPADPLTGFIAGMVARAPDPHSLLNLAEGLAAEAFDPEREAPAKNVLFLAGTEDPMAGAVDTLEPFIPGSRTLRVPGDHMGALASEAFRREALAFL